MAKIERQLLEMHKDFRQIMDGINETNAQQQINKFAKLLTEIEKVSKFKTYPQHLPNQNKKATISWLL